MSADAFITTERISNFAAEPPRRKHDRSISDVPQQVDLAVVVTPAESVPAVIEECSHAVVRGAIIISAGFREAGPRGVELERGIAAFAGQSGMRIIGPNCLGVMCPTSGLNATFANCRARRGNVALMSQSGAICTALLDWSAREQVGFSALMSIVRCLMSAGAR